MLDGGALGTAESSMAKVAVSEAPMHVADRSVQVMGAGVSGDTIVEQVFREMSNPTYRLDTPASFIEPSLPNRVEHDGVEHVANHV